MAVSIKCPQCGGSYGIRDELVGKRVKCKCGHAFVVPKASLATEAADLGPDSASDQLSDLFDEALPPTESGPALANSFGGQSAQASGQRVLGPVKRPAKKSGPSVLVIGAIVAGSIVAVLLIGRTIFLLAARGASDDTAAAGDAASESDSGSEAKSQPGFATPEQAFEALQKAEQAKDWPAQLAVHTPESRERIVGSVAYAAIMFGQFSGKRAEITDFLKKHGADPSILEEQPSEMQLGDLSQMFSKGDPTQMLEKMEKQQRQLVAPIEDKPAFYADLMAFMEEAGTARQENMPGISSALGGRVVLEEAQRAHAEAKLVDVQISGDTAQGKKAVAWHGRTMKLPVHFRRIDGRWYVHQPGVAEAMEEATEVGKQIGRSIAERMAGQGGGSPRIEIKARIDGQEKVYVYPDRIQWEHVNWGWPKNVTINGARWDPEKTQTFRPEPRLRAALLDVDDFRSARIEQTKGRNAVILAKSEVHLMVIFDDHQPGADDYEIAISFED